MAILEARNLGKRFGQKAALQDFSVAIEPGRLVGLLGPNGSGKSTFLKLCNGLITPSAGEILIEGQRPGAGTKRIVSYLPERGVLSEWMTVRQALGFFADFYPDFDRERAEAMLDALGLERGARIKTLSKGTKEKLQLLLTMARRAKLYLLDEPIGGVDPAARDVILNTIVRNYDQDAVVVISTHLIADVESILDDVIFLKEGRLERFAPADSLRESSGGSIDSLFREVFR
ncbi:MAG: ABC transporter ATP-binding protein [Christensenellaceae bacterium]|jgi:ABC-2 type transport system ATP-binding protein|nr:ABC transporter ATP-binding protein [Christensenellaceae bacterium]